MIKHRELLSFFEQITGKERWYEFINEAELRKMTKADRSNCVLSTKKIEELGINLTEVKEALKETFDQYKTNNI